MRRATKGGGGEDSGGGAGGLDEKPKSKMEKMDKKKDDRGLKGDYLNVAILLLLYTLQGVPLGLSQTMDLILQEKKLSFDEQGVFSFMSWPYSLKILWAPIVDTIFIQSFGRRKSWLVPTQLLIGILLLVAPMYIPDLLGDTSVQGIATAGDDDDNDGSLMEGKRPQVFKLTALFFVFYLLAATQDIAVDGWAVTMLARRNIGYASTCNAVGQTFGFFIAFTGYLGLQMYGLCTLETFMYCWGVIFVVTTILVALFKHEKTEAEIKENLEKDRLENSSDEDEDDHDGDIPVSIAEAYHQMSQVIHLPAVRSLLVILFTRGIAFASADSLAQRKLVEKGMKKEHVASLTVIITPLNIILPGIVSKQTSNRPLSLFKKVFLPRVIIGIFSLLLVLFAPDFEQHPDSIPWEFFISLVVVVVCHSILQSAMFVSIMAFFAQVSDPSIGGTYMTLLNTMANLGSKWPNQMVLFLVDHLTLYDCDASGENCVKTLDGFIPITIMCVGFGIYWYHRFGTLLDRLQNLDRSAWRVSALTKDY